MATKKTPVSSTEDSSPVKALETAIKMVSSACEAPEMLMITAGKKSSITLSATNNGSEAAHRALCIIEGFDVGDCVKLPLATMLSAIRGRKTGELSLSEDSITFKSGSYKYRMAIADADYTPAMDVPEGAVHCQLTGPLLAMLNSVLPRLRIEKIHSTMPDALLDIRIASGKIYLACFDTQQTCVYRGKSEEGLPSELRLTIPYTRFTSFLKDLPAANADLYVTDDSMYLVSTLFKARVLLPLIDRESTMSPDDVFAGVSEVLKEQASERVSLSAQELKQFVDNSKDLLGSMSTVVIEPSKSGSGVRLHVGGWFQRHWT